MLEGELLSKINGVPLVFTGFELILKINSLQSPLERVWWLKNTTKRKILLFAVKVPFFQPVFHLI
jgi:hypothetical protein